jgi:hypothetical protein
MGLKQKNFTPGGICFLGLNLEIFISRSNDREKGVNMIIEGISLSGVELQGALEALLASIEYEKERGRAPEPRINLGFLHYLSTSRGGKCVGAIKIASALTGIHLPAAEVLTCHAQGVWLDFDSEAGVWYASDEKIA